MELSSQLVEDDATCTRIATPELTALVGISKQPWPVARTEGQGRLLRGFEGASQGLHDTC